MVSESHLPEDKKIFEREIFMPWPNFTPEELKEWRDSIIAAPKEHEPVGTESRLGNINSLDADRKAQIHRMLLSNARKQSKVSDLPYSAPRAKIRPQDTFPEDTTWNRRNDIDFHG
jgi:hypothetical protein